MFEYGSRAGFLRLWRLFQERGHKATVFGVATALEKNPADHCGDARSAMGHCQSWPQMDRLQGFLLRRERAQMAEAIRIHTRRPASVHWAGTLGGVQNIRLDSCWTMADFFIPPIPTPTICLIG